jgi:hypothetical protein
VDTTPAAAGHDQVIVSGLGTATRRTISGTMDDLLSLAEAAQFLGLAPVTLRAAVARGTLAARKFGQT